MDPFEKRDVGASLLVLSLALVNAMAFSVLRLMSVRCEKSSTGVVHDWILSMPRLDFFRLFSLRGRSCGTKRHHPMGAKVEGFRWMHTVVLRKQASNPNLHLNPPFCPPKIECPRKSRIPTATAVEKLIHPDLFGRRGR